jgi:hypothetical protein
VAEILVLKVEVVAKEVQHRLFGLLVLEACQSRVQDQGTLWEVDALEVKVVSDVHN